MGALWAVGPAVRFGGPGARDSRGVQKSARGSRRGSGKEHKRFAQPFRGFRGRPIASREPRSVHSREAAAFYGKPERQAGRPAVQYARMPRTESGIVLIVSPGFGCRTNASTWSAAESDADPPGAEKAPGDPALPPPSPRQEIFQRASYGPTVRPSK
jgi:hypothetical protein